MDPISKNIIAKRNVATGYGPESICYKCLSDQTAGGGVNTGNSKTFVISIQQAIDLTS